jgi:TrmH family RNA methyltransferase
MKRYKKGDPISYTLGVYPTLELLASRALLVREVILSTKGGRNEGIVKIRGLCASGGIACTESDRVIERLSPKENCLAIGAFEVYAEDLDPRAAHVVLVRPSNRGNASTIMRTMAGFGFHDLALIGPSIDPFDPQAVRASIGSVFRLRVCGFPDMDGYA